MRRIVHPFYPQLMSITTLCLLSACSPMTPKSFDFTPENSHIEQFWPQSPEVPRFRYYGTLHGESDFVIDEIEGGFRRLMMRIIGLDSDSAPLDLLTRPQSGVVFNDRIYVTDMARKAVFVFDPVINELQVWESGDGSGSFVAPIGICVLASGEVLVADAAIGRVFRLDERGNPLSSFGSGDVVRPTGLACDTTREEIYVADTASHTIVVFNAEGEKIREIGRAGTGAAEFNAPTHLAFANDQLLVSDTLNARVQVINRDGTMQTSIGKRGLFVGNLVRPKGVGFDSDGNIYVIEGYFDRLLVYNSSGELLLALGSSGKQQGEFFLPTGLWVDDRDRVFVADMFNNRVAIFQYLGE